MTWREQRIVKILVTIVIVLTAALLVVFSMRYREKQQAQLENPDLIVQGQVLDAGDYNSLFVETDSATLTFSLDANGSWIWSDEPAFPLDDAKVRDVITLLDTIQPQQTLAMEGGPEAYALESPRATVIGTRADGTTRTIQLGKTTTDGQSYYAMIDGNEETVYILPGSLHDLLETPIYDMCRLPELPELTEEDLVSVTVLGHLGDRETAPSRAFMRKDGAWTLEGSDVTENSRFQALLEDVLALKIQRCVDYAPSEHAVEICGLLDPEAVLNVTYLADSGAEQTLQVQVGIRVTDGSGRYIRLNSDDTIYFLPTELLDPLMAIASRGLEG